MIDCCNLLYNCALALSHINWPHCTLICKANCLTSCTPIKNKSHTHTHTHIKIHAANGVFSRVMNSVAVRMMRSQTDAHTLSSLLQIAIYRHSYH